MSESRINRILTKVFVKDAYLILLSDLLKNELDGIDSYKRIYFLNNGVANPMTNEEFGEYIGGKFGKINRLHVLFLSNMLREKGYHDVLELAKAKKGSNLSFHLGAALLR